MTNKKGHTEIIFVQTTKKSHLEIWVYK